MNNEWEKRFDEIFMREDGLLDVGKYDEESLKSFITNLLASQRADWLRSEIEKLEGIKKTLVDEYDTFTDKQIGYNQALTSIITRYKEELLELDRNEV